MTLGREGVQWYGQNSGNFVAFDEVTVWDRKDCDSDFCVLQGLVELKKNGIYAHALIKKEDIGQNMFQGMLSLSTSTTKR